MTRDQWEMNAVKSLQKVQDKKARDMIVEKNRKIAYKMGWRRLWDGRGGAKYAKWKQKHDVQRLYNAAKVIEPGLSDSDGGEGATERKRDKLSPRSRKETRMAKTSEYNIPGTYSDPRTRDFPFAPDTASEDEQDVAERENLELSSEDEFVPSDGGVDVEDPSFVPGSGPVDDNEDSFSEGGDADEEDGGAEDD